MSKPIPPYLKLLPCEPLDGGRALPRGAVSVEGLSAAFSAATGWTLRIGKVGPNPSSQFDPWTAPAHPGVGVAPGSHAVEIGDWVRPDARPRVSKAAAAALASEIGGLLHDVRTLQRALCEREAELAAGVPVISHRAEEEHLATRLHGVLKAGAEAVGCHAAALYLLDDATSELKMRAAFGLPMQSLLAPARPLRGALADLEALLGHAVVLDSPAVFNAWAAPDDFTYGAAVCVPVSSPTIPLGTLWMFSVEPRDFSDRETHLVEMVAGRLAADLERTMLLQSGATVARNERERSDFGESNAATNHLTPTIIPGWEFAADIRHPAMSGKAGGTFVDWWTRADGTHFFCAATARPSSGEAQRIANTIRTALRAHSDYVREPGELLQRVNQLLWSGSSGDHTADVWLGSLDPQTEELRHAFAGNATTAIFGGKSPVSPPTAALELGLDPEAKFLTHSVRPRVGEFFIARSGDAAFDRALPYVADRSAAELARALFAANADQCSTCAAGIVLQKKS